MFKLKENFEIKKNVLKCDFIRYSPSKISRITTANSQIFIEIPRKDSVFSLLNSNFDLYFDERHAATGNRYVDGNDIRLVTLGPIDLFSSYRVKTSSGKHLQDISHEYKVSLRYYLITSTR